MNNRAITAWARKKVLEEASHIDGICDGYIADAYEQGFKHGLSVAADWIEKFHTELRTAPPGRAIVRRYKNDADGPFLADAIRKLKP
jgi:hypothetical protein